MTLFIPIYILFVGLPALTGIVLFLASVYRTRTDTSGPGGFKAVMAPYEDFAISRPLFGVEVILYAAPVTAFSIMLSTALDGSLRVTVLELFSPLIAGFALAVVFHLGIRHWKKALLDLLLLVFVSLVAARLQYRGRPIGHAPWFALLTPVWLLDLLGPGILVHYLFRSRHSPTRKTVTALIILGFLLPSYAFQLLLAHRLDGGNRTNWVNIFVPLFVSEALVFGPFILLSVFLSLRFFCGCLLGPKERPFEPI